MTAPPTPPRSRVLASPLQQVRKGRAVWAASALTRMELT